LYRGDSIGSGLHAAVIVSPLIEAGTVFRAPEGQTIDHTSVLKTIHERWGHKTAHET
jgi:hypothetical protein